MSTTMATSVLNALTAVTSITSRATGGIYDRDLRRSGTMQTSPAYDTATGLLKPSLMIDDAGTVREPFSHTAHYQGLFYIWVFAARTVKGEVDVRELTRRVQHTLYQWQEPSTGALLLPTMRLGMQSDDEAVFDRLSFSYSGVFPLSNV